MVNPLSNPKRLHPKGCHRKTIILCCFQLFWGLLGYSDDQVGVFSLGPTGVLGKVQQNHPSPHIQVMATFKGSPAEEIISRGDVIVGINSQIFSSKTKIIQALSEAILKAEAREDGRLNLIINKNRKNSTQKEHEPLVLDARRIFIQKSMEPSRIPGQERAPLWIGPSPIVASLTRDLKSNHENVALHLTPNGAFKNSSPSKCSKSEAITKKALEYIRDTIRRSPQHMGQRFLNAHALLGSGSVEDLDLVRTYVRSTPVFSPQRTVDRLHPDGSMLYGLQCLFAAQYYLQTNDAYIRDPLFELASAIAEGQANGGSWGKRVITDRLGRSFLPGVDNLTGGICSLALTMTMRSGIESPEIANAIDLSGQYYETLLQQGGVPVGIKRTNHEHFTQGRDGVAALSLAMMGKKEVSEYFSKRALIESLYHHQEDVPISSLIWSTLATTQLGHDATKLLLEKTRWWRTLNRRHDGGFFIHRPQGGILSDDEATAIHLLPLLSIKRKNLLHGLEVKVNLSKSELKQIDQIHQPSFEKILSKTKTSDLLASGNHFHPSIRIKISKEIGQRFLKGKEPNLIRKITERFNRSSPLERAFAVTTLSHCGEQELRKNLPLIQVLWKDPIPFVKMAALNSIKSLQPAQDFTIASNLITVLLQDSNQREGVKVNSSSDIILEMLFKDTSNESPSLLNDPLDFGLETHVLRNVMEHALNWNPGRLKVLLAAERWPKEMIQLMIGPLTHAASSLPLIDAPFSAQTMAQARKLLNRFGYHQQLIESVTHELISVRELSRSQYNQTVTYSTWNQSLFDPHWLNLYPMYSKLVLYDLKRLRNSFPLYRDQKGSALNQLIKKIEQSSAQHTNNLLEDITKLLYEEIKNFKTLKEKVAYCQSLLKKDSHQLFFQMASLSVLTDLNKMKALPEIIPFLGHDHWKMREHVLNLIVSLGKQTTLPLCHSFSNSTSADEKAGIMLALTELADKRAFPTVFAVTVSEDSSVRRQATKALFSTTDLVHLDRMLVLLKASTDELVLKGLEESLSLFPRDSTKAEITSIALVRYLQETTPQAFGSFCHILSKLGGWENLNTLAQSIIYKDEDLGKRALEALSLSPDTTANQHLINVLEQTAGTTMAFSVAEKASRRMVMAPEEGGFSNQEDRFEFAEKILTVVSDPTTLKLLGNIPTESSARLLLSFLEQGTLDVSDAAIHALLQIGSDLINLDDSQEKINMNAILAEAKKHLTEHRLNTEDLLTGELLYPKTQKQISALDRVLQEYPETKHSK